MTSSRGGAGGRGAAAVRYGDDTFAPSTPSPRGGRAAGGGGGGYGGGGYGGGGDPGAKERRVEHSALVKLRHATRSRAGHQRLLDACRRLDRGGTGLVGAKELGAVLQQAGPQP